jgi:Fe-S-cluster containining protein
MIDSVKWLAAFYERFEAETKLLYQTEPAWRVCQKCPDGYCCSKPIYSVGASAGNPFLLEDWALMLGYVRDNYSPVQKDKLTRNVLSHSENCIFLADGRCGLHPARPWSCRTHPYTASFYPNPSLFPVGKLALPSCPALAASFGLKGLKKDHLLVQSISMMERFPNSRLVKAKLKKHKPVWLIDASSFVQQLEENMPPADRPQAEWRALFSLAEQAGGGHGEVLASYVEKVTQRKL